MNAQLAISMLAIIISAGSAVFVFVFIKKLSVLIKNTTGKGLDKDFLEFLNKLNDGERAIIDLQEIIKNHETRLKLSTTGIGVVRYNPFQDTGGDLSYSVAFLNELDNGVVISSIHGREGTRTYAKSITEGASKNNLSSEENNAIAAARENRKNV